MFYDITVEAKFRQREGSDGRYNGLDEGMWLKSTKSPIGSSLFTRLSYFISLATPIQTSIIYLQNMYDEGDDEMKRTIAKAWSDARSGKAADPLKGYP